MKEITKIYIAVMVLLIMITNISYSVTYSICGMSSMSKCSCGMSDDNTTTATKEISFKKVSCCSEEVKNIINSSDFEIEQERVKNTDIVQILFVLNESTNISKEITPKSNLLIYLPKRDIPVQYSRLII